MGYNRHVFTRNDSNNPKFIYQGNGVVKQTFDQLTAKVIWDFSLDYVEGENQDFLPEEVDASIVCHNEGAKKTNNS